MRGYRKASRIATRGRRAAKALPALLACFAVGVASPVSSSLKPQQLKLSAVRPHQSPATLLFSQGGELLAVHRVLGRDNRSTGIQIYEFDSDSCRLTQSARLPAAELTYSKRKNSFFDSRIKAARFVLSSEGNLLLYAEVVRTPSGDLSGIPVMVIATNPLRVVSRADTRWIPINHPVPVGFSPDGRSVVVVGRDETQGEPQLRQVRLDSGDLETVVEDLRLSRPPIGALRGIASQRSWWFDTKFEARPPIVLEKLRALLEYDPNRQAVVWEVTTGEFIAGIIPQGDTIIAVTDTTVAEGIAGRIVRFERPRTDPVAVHAEAECGFKDVVASPDGRYGAALCQRSSRAEWNFGALLLQKVVVFRTSDLKVVSEIPFSRSTRLHSVALWHGAGQVRLAIHDESRTVRLYRFRPQ